MTRIIIFVRPYNSGLGVVYRRDFDNPFSFLRRKKKNAADSVKNVIESVNAKKEEEEDAAGNE